MSDPLYSWGCYPAAPQVAHACSWMSDVAVLRDRVIAAHGSTLPYGNGRSYGDSCLAASDQVLHMRTLDRFIESTQGQVVDQGKWWRQRHPQLRALVYI